MPSTYKSRATLPLIAIFALIIPSLIVWSMPAMAQVSGATLSGLVTDTSGATVGKTTVSIKNVATGEVREVQANDDGFYSVPNLLPGTYDVTFTAQGFSKSVQKGVTLTVGAEQVLNASLKPGQVSETVEVVSTPPDVQTTTSAVSSTVDSKTIRELPLNGRDWTSLATLEPGVASVPNQATTSFNANKGNRGFGNQLTDSGHRPNENNYRLNGVSINDYSNAAPGGATGLNLGVDAVQEFSVITTGYTAEYGRTSGAIINAVTKSGTNGFHGTGFFFDRDKIFDARNYFDTDPRFRLFAAPSLEARLEARSLKTRHLSLDRMKAFGRTNLHPAQSMYLLLRSARWRSQQFNLTLPCGRSPRRGHQSIPTE